MCKNIRLSLVVLVISFFLSSCGTTKLDARDAGRLTIVSTKNVKLDGDYVMIARNAGFDGSQLSVVNSDYKRSTRKTILENYYRLRSETVSGAIDNVVESTPGGVYMENMELYQISDRSSSTWDYFIVSGDVYGIAGQKKQIRGYIVGTKAFYKRDSGEVVTLIDDQRCLWKSDNDDKYYEVLYDELTKIGE
jgi:hypothetical protein